METVKGKVHHKTVVQYVVQIQDTNTVIRNLKVTVITLAAFTNLLILFMCSSFVFRHTRANKKNHTGCGTENRNNNQGITGRPGSDQSKALGSTTYNIQFNRGSDSATEEDQNTETESVISILILPEGNVARVPEEGVEADNGYVCKVNDIIE